jgi:Type I phosphodiesterase / nucleotide pyrophosphatase
MTWRTCFTGVICIVLAPIQAARADNRVLVIGIDGAGGRFLRDASTPNIDALIANGIVRYDYLNEGALVPNPPAGYGASGANWSTITTGVSAVHHGVSDNSFAGSRFDTYPHFFKHVKDHDAASYTASIVSWEPINGRILANQYANLERHFPNLSSANQDALVRDNTASLLLHGDPDAIFLHFDQVDAAGHANGWASSQFYAAIQTVDRHIGDIMTALNGRAGVAAGSEDWLIIITADHGGQGTGHDASQGLINWEVPFVLSGDSVPSGAQLTQGSLRDVVPTALWHLGIDPFALSLDGTVRGLVVGPPNGIVADLNQDGVVSGNGTGPASSDDVTAFVAGWLSQGGGSIAARYSRGDLNFDGFTDIGDWAILNRENPALGAAAFARLANVPEPTAILMLIIFVPPAILMLRKTAGRRNESAKLRFCGRPRS